MESSPIDRLHLDGEVYSVETFHGTDRYLRIRIPHFPYDWTKSVLLTDEEFVALGGQLKPTPPTEAQGR